MTTTRGMRLRLGLFVLLAAVLFASLILMFGSLPDLFKRSTTYTVRFTDAPGLVVGAPVRRSGVRVGTVRDVVLDEERGIVRARIAVDAPYRIRKSEQATLVTGVLGGDTSIDLVPRPVDEKEPIDRTPVEPETELIGIRAATVSTLLKGASEVVPTTQETLNDIRKSIQRVEKTMPLVDDTLKEYRELAREMRRTLPELQRTNTEVRELARAGREAVPEFQRAAEEHRLLARDARAALPQVAKTSRELELFLRDGRELFPAAERAIDEFRELTADARRLVPTVRDGIDDVRAAARQTQQLAEQATVLIKANRPAIEAALNGINRVLSEANIENTSRLLKNVSTASDRLPQMSQDAEAILKEGRGTVRQMNATLKRLEETLEDLQKTVRPFGGRSERISRNAEESLAKLNEILGDVRALMRVVDRSDGTLRRFLTDPSLFNNLDNAAATVLKLMPRIDRILKDFEVFADKLARHPEAIGLGGVVRPGSGLKNPPTPPLPSGHGPVIHHPTHSPKR